MKNKNLKFCTLNDFGLRPKKYDNSLWQFFFIADKFDWNIFEEVFELCADSINHLDVVKQLNLLDLLVRR